MKSNDPQPSIRPANIEETKVAPTAISNETLLKVPVKETMPRMPQKPLSPVGPHFPLVPPRPRD